MTAAKEVASRIYRIVSRTNPPTTLALVRAINVAQARAHYTEATFTVELPSQDDLIAAAKAGIEVADANAWRRQEADSVSVRG